MDKGSRFGGFLLGFIFGVVGLIIALCIDTPKTKRGAVAGFFVSIALKVIIVICIWLGGLIAIV